MINHFDDLVPEYWQTTLKLSLCDVLWVDIACTLYERIFEENTKAIVHGYLRMGFRSRNQLLSRCTSICPETT